MKLSDVVKGLDGTLLSDGEFSRLDYCTVTENGPFLTFMEREKFVEAFVNNREISCVLCTEKFLDIIPNDVKGIFVTKEPKVCFEKIHNRLATDENYILENFETRIGQNCQISPLAYISERNVCIGDNVTIGPFVYVGEHVTIKSGCKIEPHATIGGRSFSYARVGKEEIVGLKDCGSVVLDEEVEIGSYTIIERGILPTDCTYLGKRTALDAHIMIGHGSHLEERVFAAAGAIIAGNVTIGKDSWIGLNATISNRVVIGKNCRISLGAVVTKDVVDDAVVTGNFAIEHNLFLRNLKEQIRNTDI